MTAPQFWTDLESRGILNQATSPTLGTWMAHEFQSANGLRGYVGIDPTADSLHVGTLMPVLGISRLKRAGLTPIILVGGATGMIGDPSGKSSERVLLDAATIEYNCQAISLQLERLMEGKAGKDFHIVNNMDWIGSIHLVEFLRDIGKHFSVNAMMAKDSVRSRLEDRDHGISYTEFSYMLLQAYDYLHLFEKHGCRLQVGGSDQWGNITAGMDLIGHKHHGAVAHGLTFPLILMSSGQKFGKSEKGNIWLDSKRTHPYFLYKYFFGTPDSDVIKLLNYLTFVPLEEIRALETELKEHPEKRSAPKRLAKELAAIVHGETVSLACEGLEAAMFADDSAAFEKFAGMLDLLDPGKVSLTAEDSAVLPVAHQPLSSLAGEGIDAMQLAVDVGLFSSKGDVKREIKSGSGAFRIGGEPVKDFEFRITSQLLGDRRVLQMKKGKRNTRMICFY